MVVSLSVYCGNCVVKTIGDGSHVEASATTHPDSVASPDGWVLTPVYWRGMDADSVLIPRPILHR